jgi:extracellular elastinolytic metalloproteinase
MRKSNPPVRLLSVAIACCLALAAGGSHAGSAAGEAAALQHLKAARQQMGLTGADINEVVVSSSVQSRHNGVTHVYLQQRHAGIDVWNGVANVNIAADGSVISIGNRLVPNVAALAAGQSARKSGVDAASAAAGHLKLKARKAFDVVSRKGGASQAVTLSDGGVAVRPIEARLVWLPVGKALRLAWSVEIEATEGGAWVYAFVDAESGEAMPRATSPRRWRARPARVRRCRPFPRPTVPATASSPCRWKARPTAAASC